MVITQSITVINDVNRQIAVNFYKNADSVILPLIIFCHGFNGFKDWGGFPYMMEHLALNGYAAVSFNFSLNGVAKDRPMEFTRLDLFAQNTFSAEFNDLDAVINY